MIQTDFVSADQILLSSNINHWDSDVIFLDQFQDFCVEQVSSTGSELDRSLLEDVIAYLLDLKVREISLSLSRKLVFRLRVHRWIYGVLILGYLEVAQVP